MTGENRNGKIFARLFDYRGDASMAAGSLTFTVEWKKLYGDREGGKAKFTITDIRTDDGLKSDLREALAGYLSTELGEQIRPRDIVGYSV